MRLAHVSVALAACLVAAPLPAVAQVEERFDIQNFRPSAAPQDLILVSQSRPLANLSVAAGFYLNYALDPLVLIPVGGERKSASLVLSRIQLDAMVSVGLLDVMELALDVPLVLAQTSDNLEAIGTEGSLRSFATGDVRLSAKIALPYLRRPAAKSGLGGAITFGLGLPTGMPDAFAGDGVLTSAPGLILDYRFESGLLIALNVGAWLRPRRELAGVLLGDMGSLALATEIPIVRRWGITAVGEVAGLSSLDALTGAGSSSNRQLPAEALLGLRWYGSNGVTLTVGGGGGCGCGLGAPAFRFFSSVIWVPGKTQERAEIERFKQPPPPPPDPDGDGVIGRQDLCPEVSGPVGNYGCPDQDGDDVLGKQDLCPDQAGPIENKGCPETDRDGDGIVDRLDRCPDAPATERGKDGCPLAQIQGDKILILEQVHFATGQDVILPESFPTLQEVARILKEHPQIERVLVEGHTDIRASDTYNMHLSQRRAASVMRYLLDQGIAPERLRSEGFGRHRPIAPNTSEAGMAVNRRVEFTIQQRATPANQAAPKPSRQGD